MMSRRRSLVGAVSRGTQRFLVYLCVAALVAPVPAHAKRGKRTSEATRNRDGRGVEPGLDTQSLPESIDREHAADAGVSTEGPAARGDQVVDPAELPGGNVAPPV